MFTDLLTNSAGIFRAPDGSATRDGDGYETDNYVLVTAVVQCRIQKYSRPVVYRIEGRDVRIAGQMWLFPNADIQKDDRILDNVTGEKYRLIDLALKKGMGPLQHHWKGSLVEELFAVPAF